MLAESRLGGRTVESIPYGKPITINGVSVSYHPAGHILGSAQIRVEHHGEVWVVSGDYKTEPDPTCAPFEPVRCDTFVTECTFGLPVYRWSAAEVLRAEIHAWLRANREAGLASVLFGYALGKAQRLIALLDGFPGPIWTHGAVETMSQLYRAGGVALPPTRPVSGEPRDTPWHEGVIIAPPSAAGSTWMRRFGASRSAFASGWMLIRGARRRRGVDQGFALSDHVDWPAMLAAVRATGASRVFATHGFTHAVVK